MCAGAGQDAGLLAGRAVQPCGTAGAARSGRLQAAGGQSSRQPRTAGTANRDNSTRQGPCKAFRVF